MRPTYCKFVVVVACREAGSGEARWHAELGIMAPVRYGSTVYEWLYGPPPPPNRAGDYPHETRYYVVPGDGRYRSAGVRGVPRAHVDFVMSCLEGATVNPHCSGTTDEGNWIDGDIPSAAIVAALLREAELAEERRCSRRTKRRSYETVSRSRPAMSDAMSALTPAPAPEPFASSGAGAGATARKEAS